MNVQSRTPSSRPGCLIVITTSLTLYQITFALSVLQQTDIVEHGCFPVAVQVALAVLWAGGFLLATIALVRRETHALRYSGWLIVAFVLFNLLRLLVFAEADYDRNRLPFMALVSAIAILVPLLALLHRD